MKIVTDHTQHCDIWRDRHARCSCGAEPTMVPSDESDEKFGKLRRHLKENPVISVGVGIMTVLAAVNVSTVAQNMKFIGSLATEDYVGGMLATERKIATSELDAHVTQSDKRFAGVEKGIDRIRAFTEIVPQLKNLLTLRCMGTRNLDDTIARLEDEYLALTGENYTEQSCERLLAVR